jgi:predicted dehydrogenase
VTARPWRAAIIGCGRKAATLDDEARCRINYSIPPDTHAAAWLATPSVTLVAAADPNESKRRLMQTRYRVPSVYADYREMLARERPDLVSIATRADLHAEATVAATQDGARGILCEKAMATSLRDADAMVDACRRTDCRLVINHTRRWHPTYERAAVLIRDGAIGDLRCLIGVCPPPLIHNGTHLFDLMRMFGGDAAWVTGEIGAQAPDGGDAPGRAMLGFRTGAVGFVDLDSRVGLAVEFQGTTGRIFIDPAEDGLTLWTYQDAAAAKDGAWYQGKPCPNREISHLPGHSGSVAGRRGTLVAAIEELIASIETGAPSRSTGEDGRAALELGLAVYASHRAGGARISLPLVDRDLIVRSR